MGTMQCIQKYNSSLVTKRPRNTGKNVQGIEMQTVSFSHNWRKMETAAQGRAGWRQVICGLSSTDSDKA